MARASAMPASANASLVSPACSRTVTPGSAAICGPWFGELVGQHDDDVLAVAPVSSLAMR